MMSVKTLLEHIETKVNRIYGVDSDEFRLFKEVAGNEFDSKFSYRFMYGLRNYVQHVGMPPLAYTLTKKINEVDGVVETNLNVFFIRDLLLSNSTKWKAEVKKELQSQPPEFTIFPIINEHYLSVLNIFSMYIEGTALNETLKARDYIFSFINQENGYDKDEYVIATLPKEGSVNLNLKYSTIPTSLLKKIEKLAELKNLIKH
ncbi:hypothetical protein ROSI111154_00005 [Rouxiella silvae]